jgi:hypothetical protein
LFPVRLHQGICGAAATSTGKTLVVDDVSTDTRYLACSHETKSEIVVPIFLRGKVEGELDIDSHFLTAFKERIGDSSNIVQTWSASAPRPSEMESENKRGTAPATRYNYESNNVRRYIACVRATV